MMLHLVVFVVAFFSQSHCHTHAERVMAEGRLQSMCSLHALSQQAVSRRCHTLKLVLSRMQSV